MTIALLALGSYLFTVFLGYWIHRAFHKSWSGPFYRAHLDHHIIQYPASNFTSEKYRSSGVESGLYYFIAAFLPVIAGIWGLCWALHVSHWVPMTIITTMVITGILHAVIHDSFHLEKTMWRHLPFYQSWKDLHWMHHKFVQRNFGVFSFVLDRLFNTFKEAGKRNVRDRKVRSQTSQVLRDLNPAE